MTAQRVRGCRLLAAAWAVGVMLESGPAFSGELEVVSFVPQAITAEAAGRYSIYAMLSSNAYHKADRVRFPVEDLGWIQVDLAGRQTKAATGMYKSGLAFDIYEKHGKDEVVFAFRGTDSKKDYLDANIAAWPFSVQYAQARKAFRAYRDKHPGKRITVTGHSLGGGLALSVSVRYGVDAIVFDSTPRIFDGLGDKHAPASRVLVYEEGEILEKVRSHWDKIFEAVPQRDIYRCSFDFGDVSKHRSDYLARGLLELGAAANPELVPVRDAVARR